MQLNYFTSAHISVSALSEKLQALFSLQHYTRGYVVQKLEQREKSVLLVSSGFFNNEVSPEIIQPT